MKAFEWEWGDYVGVLILSLLPLGLIPLLIIFFRVLRKCLQGSQASSGQRRDFLWQKKYRRRLELFMATSKYATYWIIFQVILSFAACMVYAIELYFPSRVPGWMISFEIIVTTIFLFDYLLYFYIAEDALKYFFSVFALIDLGAIIPVFISLIPGLNLQATLFTAFFRSLRILRAYKLVEFASSAVQRQVFVLVLSIVALVFCSTAIIQNLEARKFVVHQEGDDGSVTTTKEYFYFHDALYLIVITFATVGYGDITPQTVAGRMAMIFLVLFGLFVITLQTGRLVSILNSQRKYGGSFRFDPSFISKKQHIVVLGEIALIGILEFLKELFTEEKHNQNQSKKVVIMSNTEPSFELESILSHPFFATRVTFLLGNSMSQKDLERTGIERAQACYIITDKYSRDARRSDRATVLRYLSVRHYFPHVKTCIQIILPESKQQVMLNLSSHHRKRAMKRLGDSSSSVISIPSASYHQEEDESNYLMSLNELKMGLMSRSCIAPGFSTLIANLLKTHFARDFSFGSDGPTSLLSSSHLSWLHNYQKGCLQSIYGMKVPHPFHLKSFGSVVLEVYLQYGAVIFAVEISTANGGGRIVLNPGKDHLMREGDFVFLMSSNPRICRLLRSVHLTTPVSARALDIQETALESNDARVESVSSASSTTLLRDTTSSDFMRLKESREDIFSSQHHDDYSMGREGESEVIELRSLDRRSRSETYNNISLEDTILLDIEDSPWRQIYDILSPAALSRRDRVVIPTYDPINPRGHIIVSGDPTEAMLSFIAPLRSRILAGSFQSIVFLHPTHPTSNFINIISHFTDIYYVQGSILDNYDLHRAGIEKASMLVVMTSLGPDNIRLQGRGSHHNDNSVEDRSMKSASNKNALQDEYIDAEAIFSLRNIESRYPHLRFAIIEMAHASSLKLIDPSLRDDGSDAHYKSQLPRTKKIMDEISPEYHNNPFFISGNVFPTSSLDIILCHVLSNKFILQILQLLVTGCDQSLHNESLSSIKADAALTSSSQLFQIPIPIGFEGKTYGEMMEYLLLEKDILCIGLYRRMDDQPEDIKNETFNDDGSSSSYFETSSMIRERYVQSNPRPSERLSSSDFVFILSSLFPSPSLYNRCS